MKLGRNRDTWQDIDKLAGPFANLRTERERAQHPDEVVWGVDDPIAVVAMAERLHRVRPDATLTLLDGVGHYPMIEAPARFADAIARVLR